MRRLISADMARLWQWGPFRLGGAFMAVYGICNLLAHLYYGDGGPGGPALDFTVTMVYVQAITAVSFLNEDHSSGGLRNKLTVGHNRGAVYMSHLLVQYLGGLIYAGLYILPVLVLGGPAYKGPGVLARLGCYTAVLLSFTAVYTFLGLLIPGRWIRVGAFAGAFLMMTVCTRMDSGLAIPKTAPACVPEPLRSLYGLILDVSPTGEAMQLLGVSFRQSELWVLAVSGLGVALIVTIFGMIGFLRMDIE